MEGSLDMNQLKKLESKRRDYGIIYYIIAITLTLRSDESFPQVFCIFFSWALAVLKGLGKIVEVVFDFGPFKKDSISYLVSGIIILIIIVLLTVGYVYSIYLMNSKLSRKIKIPVPIITLIYHLGGVWVSSSLFEKEELSTFFTDLFAVLFVIVIGYIVVDWIIARKIVKQEIETRG